MKRSTREMKLAAAVLILFILPGMAIPLAGKDTPPLLPEPQLIRERTFSEIPGTYYSPESVRKDAEDFFSNNESRITIGSEFLYVTRDVFPAAEMLDIYNGMLGFKNMIGVTYYSERDNKEHVLVTDSFRVAGPENREPLPDLMLTEIQHTLKVYIVQEMEDFGEVLWEVNYRYQDNYLLAILSNAEPIYMGPFKIVERGNMSVILSAVPADEDVVIYQAGKVYSAGMQFLSFIGLRGFLEETFYERMKAIQSVYAPRND